MQKNDGKIKLTRINYFSVIFRVIFCNYIASNMTTSCKSRIRKIQLFALVYALNVLKKKIIIRVSIYMKKKNVNFNGI